MAKLLTKSKYMNGMQCQKLLWLVFNDPGRIPAPDAATQMVFDQGHLVGELAHRLFTGGIAIPTDDFRSNLKMTQNLLSQRRPLFEAGFMVNNLFSRVDILNPVGIEEWEIVEVKSSTSVKDENIQDVAFQKYCAQKAGLKIVCCRLAYINNQYEKQGEIQPQLLFTIQDISEQVREAEQAIDQRIAAMQKIISSPVCPDVPVGLCCSQPYACNLDFCWQPLADYNIFNLYRGGKKVFDLFYEGILNIREIPPDFKLNRSQEIQKECDISGQPHIEPEKIREFLDLLKTPEHYLDFETINPAVPLFNGTRPYQRIPFQFSLHVSQGGQLHHYSFLAEGRDDPRPAFLRRLKECIGPSGSIVTYNQAFEEGVLKELAAGFPDYAGWVEEVRGRMVDLLKPFQHFSYYHPEQNGSASIKNVLPVLTGHSYQEMGIHGGEEASTSFMQVTYGQSSAEERQRVREDLEKYCGLDSLGMLWIVEKLREMT